MTEQSEAGRQPDRRPAKTGTTSTRPDGLRIAGGTDIRRPPRQTFWVNARFTCDPRVAAAGNNAVGLYVRAGAWSACYRTGGYVPAQIVALLGTPAQARRLLDVGLLVEDGGGYLLVTDSIAAFGGGR